MGFREFITTNQTLILCGRNAENNEELIKQAGKSDDIFHTKKAGSPFVNIKGKTRRGDIKQAAIICAAYSKDWKKNKDDVVVHRFKGKHVYKDKDMKKGTFGVRKLKEIKVKKEDIEDYLKEAK